MMPSIMSGSLIRRHAALGPDVGRHPLQRHHRDGAGVLGDLGLLGGDHVHDHAALEHLGHPALDPRGAGAAGGGRGGAAVGHGHSFGWWGKAGGTQTYGLSLGLTPTGAAGISAPSLSPARRVPLFATGVGRRGQLAGPRVAGHRGQPAECSSRPARVISCPRRGQPGDHLVAEPILDHRPAGRPGARPERVRPSRWCAGSARRWPAARCSRRPASAAGTPAATGPAGPRRVSPAPRPVRRRLQQQGGGQGGPGPSAGTQRRG